MEAPLNLLDLGDDVLSLIFEEVGVDWRESLVSLLKVSRQCYIIAYPILWHSVTLYESKYIVKQREKIGEVLLNEQYGARNLVREICVQGYSRRVKGVDPVVLEKILDGLSMLRSFRWETPHIISENVISKLEKRWPDASLHVVSNHSGSLNEDSLYSMDSASASEDGWDPGNLTVITDRLLLSSSLLCSLDYKIRWISDDRNLFSELNTVCDMIARSPKLENLKIGFYHMPGPGNRKGIKSSELMSMKLETPESHDIPDISLPPDIQLPQLTELKTPLYEKSDIGYGSHFVTLTMVLLWRLSQWKTPIKTLKLEQLSHHLPFDQLEGRTPNLRVLDIVLDSSEDFDNYYPAVRFIRSCNSLQKLRVQNKTRKIEDIWPAVLKHKDSLRELRLGTELYYTQTSESHWYRRFPHPLLTVQEFASLPSFPLLLEVEIDISLADAEAFINFGAGTGGDIETLTERGRTLLQMGNVEILTLNVEIPVEECKFTNASVRHSQMPPIRKSAMRAAVVGLFDQILAQDPTCRIQLVRFNFNNCGSDECTYEQTVFTASVFAKRMDENTLKRITSDKDSDVNVSLIGIRTGVVFHAPTDSPYCTWDVCD